MKFGKRLKQQIQETLPDWRDSFLSYKELKKVVKLISSTQPLSDRCGTLETYQFVDLLNREIDKLNSFFLGKEEDFIIRHKELQQRIMRVVDSWGPKGSQPSEILYKDEMAKIRKDIIDFHGEMVLLENYSNINYTGLAKILKKYDKRTGCVLRLAFIQKVSEQPFFITDMISKLVKECEDTIDLVFPSDQEANAKAVKEAVSLAGAGIFRNAVVALFTMQEIRRGSSTYSHFSLPPLSLSDADYIDSLKIT